MPAGDGNVLLGRQGAAGRSEKGAGPRHGRSAVLRYGSGGGRAEWLCGHLGGETGLRDRGKEWTGGLEVEVVSETDGAGGSVGPAAGDGIPPIWTAGAVCAHAQWGDPAVPGSTGGGAGGGRRHLQADPDGGRCDGGLFRPGGRAGAGGIPPHGPGWTGAVWGRCLSGGL
ncbi:translation initiation factor IF-3, partial [Dysosmobacter welbionis]